MERFKCKLFCCQQYIRCEIPSQATIIIESFFFFCRTQLEKAKKEQEDRLEYVKEQLEICSHDSKRQIKEITAKVEAQVKNFTTSSTSLLDQLFIHVSFLKN